MTSSTARCERVQTAELVLQEHLNFITLEAGRLLIETSSLNTQGLHLTQVDGGGGQKTVSLIIADEIQDVLFQLEQHGSIPARRKHFYFYFTYMEVTPYIFSSLDESS